MEVEKVYDDEIADKDQLRLYKCEPAGSVRKARPDDRFLNQALYRRWTANCAFAFALRTTADEPLIRPSRATDRQRISSMRFSFRRPVSPSRENPIECRQRAVQTDCPRYGKPSS